VNPIASIGSQLARRCPGGCSRAVSPGDWVGCAFAVALERDRVLTSDAGEAFQGHRWSAAFCAVFRFRAR
jgi:hypothetical protein